MQVLFFVLNETEYLDEILIALADAGVRGATVLDSQGMSGTLVNTEDDEVPVLHFFKSFLETSHPYNKTIFTVLETEELVDKVVDAIKSVIGDIDEPGIGLIFTLPVSKIYGIS